ncbi:MAG TPA: pyridoxamine 5'-phosphate oxidase family protein [Chitinophagaceae bacterium]|nr:pyridoxamine 5'-phosphate oxidase family protein [Chitinophagaceae bacterium]
MFGQLNNEEIDELIKSQLVCRIGCHAEGIIYVVPMSYAYDGPYIYGHTYEGKKIEMMRKNPRVCFEVDSTRNLANWQSVIAWGEFEELNEKDDKAKALKILNDRALPFLSSETMHLTPQWPFLSDINDIPGIFFRILLLEKTGRFEKNVTVNESSFSA